MSASLSPGFQTVMRSTSRVPAVGQEKRRVAARPRRRECAAAAATGRRRRRQIPERQSGESGARADQQRFLDLAQGDRRVRGLVPEGPLRHLEAETEPPRAPAIESLEQWVAPGQVQQFRRRHQLDPRKNPRPARNEQNLALYWIGKMVHFRSLQQTTY